MAHVRVTVIALILAALGLIAGLPAGVAPAQEISQEQLVTKAPPPKPPDWNDLAKEATGLLSQYIRINTTNPPGNEMAGAQLLKEKFLADGIPATVWQTQPGRGIVAARLHGIGKHTKAVVLLSHIDVVPANPKDWKVPPFSGQVINGEIWGRGALDDKGPGVVELMAMLAIKRAGILLDRDVIFIATPDEEAGGSGGAGWMVAHQRKVFSDAGYLLNEGGAIMVKPNGAKLFDVSTTEKTPMWVRLTAQGQSGHAAVPPDQTSVTRLVQAINRLIAWHPPLRVIGPVQRYFRTIARLDGGPAQFRDLRRSLGNHAFRKQFLANPVHAALVRDTIAPTMLLASDKINVIPAVASAEIDCRLLPGDNPKSFLNKLRKVIGDPSIKIDVLLNFPSVSSPDRSILMNAISDLARREKAPVAATMTAGFTDSHYFRDLGIVAYGFVPLEITPAQERTIHGANERIPVKNLGDGIRRMVRLLEFLGGR
jgi:acetylornithine deacetylase/succinyl-diaminopimelate desuccinylase-like protein